MIYYLSEEQYTIVCIKYFKHIFSNDYVGRLKEWNKLYPNLDYTEINYARSPDFYAASVEGEEKDINWFLLQL